MSKNAPSGSDEFDPPAPQQTIRKRPIDLGSVVDLQQESLGQAGFLSVSQCWHRVGGDLNREMVVPTLAASSIGHEILGVPPGTKGKLASALSIRIRATWQNPDWPAYNSWQYLSEWSGDGNASYYSIDSDTWAPHSIWTIEKIVDGKVAAEGTVISSGDKVRIRTKNAKNPDRKHYLARGETRHKNALHPWVASRDSTPEQIEWIIWSQGSAR